MVLVIMAMTIPAYGAGPRAGNGAFEDCGVNNWSESLTNGHVTFNPDGRIATPSQGGEYSNDNAGLWTIPTDNNKECDLEGDSAHNPGA